MSKKKEMHLMLIIWPAISMRPSNQFNARQIKANKAAIKLNMGWKPWKEVDETFLMT